MATMNISLPDDMRAYVEAQVKGGFYANSSDFIRAAIREHKESLERLDDLIQEGLDSGWSEESFDEIIAGARRRTKSRAA
ncbi:MAG: type II toxin-antitoxin system ParD family antitoxin [Sphingosinicella sp.]|uniref:type II toxin-antitoxin system ParD family antitoxin n=1 Tax=Sphingosinicella sp. TaxID=1917971 RepID=UPI004037CA16